MKSMLKIYLSIFMILLIVIFLVFLLTGCGNKKIFDTTYTFDKAIISLPNGAVVEGSVTNWSDYDGSDQIQVKIDGKVYLVHSEDIVLISE